MFGKIDDIAPL